MLSRETRYGRNARTRMIRPAKAANKPKSIRPRRRRFKGVSDGVIAIETPSRRSSRRQIMSTAHAGEFATLMTCHTPYLYTLRNPSLPIITSHNRAHGCVHSSTPRGGVSGAVYSWARLTFPLPGEASTPDQRFNPSHREGLLLLHHPRADR